jgi:hypothetical protein
VSGEDCIAHDLDNLSILDEGSHFILTDGQSRMVAFPNGAVVCLHAHVMLRCGAPRRPAFRLSRRSRSRGTTSHLAPRACRRRASRRSRR